MFIYNQFILLSKFLNLVSFPLCGVIHYFCVNGFGMALLICAKVTILSWCHPLEGEGSRHICMLKSYCWNEISIT